jgi:two-component system cell cycle sensor histidine kinase/response regulator CckA
MNFFRRNTPPPAVIFVVDDEVALLELAAVILGEKGYEVRTFTEPELALKEFEKVRPALVLTDYWMPRMSGMDLIRECRRLNPRQKAVLISGTVDGQVFAGAVVQPDRFLAKPYQVQMLTNTVEELLAARDGG